MFDHSRKGQKWITEEFYKVLDVYGFRAVMFVEWGFRPATVKRTTERIRVPGAVVKEWVRTARQEEDLARAAEAGLSLHRSAQPKYYVNPVQDRPRSPNLNRPAHLVALHSLINREVKYTVLQ